MKRRSATVALTGLLGFAAAPGTAGAQQAGKVYRIGYLALPPEQFVPHIREAFVRRLRELGWVEGQNLAIEWRSADGDVARMPDLAAELVQREVDVIVTPGTSAALAAKKATSRLPIIMVFPVNPVEQGLIASLSRPDGNVTGTTSALGPEIFGKQLQIRQEAVPRATRVAILQNPADRSTQYLREVQAAARALRIRLQIVEASSLPEFDSAFAAMARDRADALLLAGTPTF